MKDYVAFEGMFYKAEAGLDEDGSVTIIFTFNEPGMGDKKFKELKELVATIGNPIAVDIRRSNPNDVQAFTCGNHRDTGGSDYTPVPDPGEPKA